MTQLENLKNQIKELEKSCDEARDRIKNENLPFLNIYENRAAFFIKLRSIDHIFFHNIKRCMTSIVQYYHPQKHFTIFLLDKQLLL